MAAPIQVPALPAVPAVVPTTSPQGSVLGQVLSAIALGVGTGMNDLWQNQQKQQLQKAEIEKARQEPILNIIKALTDAQQLRQQQLANALQVLPYTFDPNNPTAYSQQVQNLIQQILNSNIDLGPYLQRLGIPGGSLGLPVGGNINLPVGGNINMPVGGNVPAPYTSPAQYPSANETPPDAVTPAPATVPSTAPATTPSTAPATAPTAEVTDPYLLPSALDTADAIYHQIHPNAPSLKNMPLYLQKLAMQSIGFDVNQWATVHDAALQRRQAEQNALAQARAHILDQISDGTLTGKAAYEAARSYNNDPRTKMNGGVPITDEEVKTRLAEEANTLNERKFRETLAYHQGRLKISQQEADAALARVRIEAQRLQIENTRLGIEMNDRVLQNQIRQLTLQHMIDVADGRANLPQLQQRLTFLNNLIPDETKYVAELEKTAATKSDAQYEAALLRAKQKLIDDRNEQAALRATIYSILHGGSSTGPGTAPGGLPNK